MVEQFLSYWSQQRQVFTSLAAVITGKRQAYLCIRFSSIQYASFRASRFSNVPKYSLPPSSWGCSVRSTAVTACGVAANSVHWLFLPVSCIDVAPMPHITLLIRWKVSGCTVLAAADAILVRCVVWHCGRTWCL